MALVNGSQILARALRKLDFDTFFYIMGGPMMAAESACLEEDCGRSTSATSRPRR